MMLSDYAELNAKLHDQHSVRINHLEEEVIRLREYITSLQHEILKMRGIN